jgi:hypothetical protein
MTIENLIALFENKFAYLMQLKTSAISTGDVALLTDIEKQQLETETLIAQLKHSLSV